MIVDPYDGRRIGTIPLAHRNITGIRATYGLPETNYLEQNYLLTFAVIVEDAITNSDTLALGILDLKDKRPNVQIIELEPFVEDRYAVFGIGTSPETHKAFFVWNDLWKVDYRTRKNEATVSLANSQAVPLIHPDGRKVYCGGQWHALAVYDAETLKHLTDVELNHSMAGIGMRFVNNPNNF